LIKSKNKDEYHILLQELITELTKKSMNQSKIKELTKKVGVPYATDLVEQMSIILKHCDQVLTNEGPRTL
jgi:hypothetical protein